VSRITLFKILMVAAMFVVTSACQSGFNRGPDPTVASIEAVTGPFVTSTTTVGNGFGFGGGTIYYPTDSSQDYGVVAIAPGWTSSQSVISWYGPRIASQGFVVITIDVNNPFTDGPVARGTQLLAALDYVSNSSTVTSIVDGDRQAVMGISMGGGGALEAAKARPALDAVVGLVPWNPDKTWPEIVTPTMLIGCQNDAVAPVSSHGLPFYNTISGVPKSFIEVTDGSHSCTSTSNSDVADRAVIAGESIAWLKRYVDQDTRYAPFVCPSPAISGSVSAAQSNC